VLCLLLHTHQSALLRGTLRVLAAKKTKEKLGDGAEGAGVHGHGFAESWSTAVQEPLAD